MNRNTRKNKRKKKFFVKDDEGIYVVYDDFFDMIGSRQEALSIAVHTNFEIMDTLMKECLDGPLFIGNMKVTTGLERTLNELDNRWPFLLKEMRSVSHRINGCVIGCC